METVYIETTVIGHLASRKHRDPVVSARQAATQDWWANHAVRYKIYISQLVLDECGAGDPTAAAERLSWVQEFDLLAATAEVDVLADALISGGAIPPTEPRDAFHIAIAAVNGIEYLLTWNFRHIANASQRGRIEQICRDTGFEPPIFCTPDELMGADDGS